MKKLLLLTMLISIGDVYAAAAGSSGDSGDDPEKDGAPSKRVLAIQANPKKLTPADRSNAVVPEEKTATGSEEESEGTPDYLPPSPGEEGSAPSSQGSDGTAATALWLGSQETETVESILQETLTADTDTAG